jgi:hypothetical protein
VVGGRSARARSSIDALAAGRWTPDFSARPYGSGRAAEASSQSLLKGAA